MLVYKLDDRCAWLDAYLSSIKQALNWETKLQRKLIGRHNQRAAISQGKKEQQAINFNNRR